ncbi:unnamed protein product, partial [Meganyctiphanes norvegica]
SPSYYSFQLGKGILLKMWKVWTLIGFASVVLLQAAAQGGAESVPFHGYLPGENVRAPAPDGDGQPNDIYEHIPVARPALQKDQVVIYPHHLGFEYGQDSEHRIYEVHTAKELANLAHGKHGKHGKHDHHHHHKGAKGHHKAKSAPTTTTTTTPRPTTTRKPARKPAYPPPRPYGAYPPPPRGAYPQPPPYPYQRPQFPPVHG